MIACLVSVITASTEDGQSMIRNDSVTHGFIHTTIQTPTHSHTPSNTHSHHTQSPHTVIHIVEHSHTMCKTSHTYCHTQPKSP